MCNYYDEVKNDIMAYIRENLNCYVWEDLEDLKDKLYEDLWIEDTVTGNGSGSYTFSTYQAEENLCHNLDLLKEALDEFGDSENYLLSKGAEAADVTIRCYLLGGALSDVLQDLKDEIPERKEDET